MSTPTSDPPTLRPPDASSNKYNRGKVVVVSGAMPGAAHLCAQAAMRSGAGYVELATDQPNVQPPYAMVQQPWSAGLLEDERIGAIAIGPGLADDGASEAKLTAVLAAGKPTVIDAGALTILARLDLHILHGDQPRILTPHEGEFVRLFGEIGSRETTARDAAHRSGAFVVLKGSETVIAAPDGRALILPPASPWLATAGTGDVLTGVIATMLAQAAWHGFDTLEAIRAACWFHARAAELAGPALIADDLLWSLKRAVAKA